MGRIIRSLLVLITIALITNLNAQESRIDSLKSITVSDVHDTFRMNAFNHLSEYYMFTNPDSGLYFANAGLKMAKNNSDKKGIGIGYRLLALNYHFMSKNDTAIYLIKQACNIFEDIGFKNGLSLCLMNQGIFHTKIDHFDEAIENYHKASMLFLEDSNYYGEAMCNVNIGSVYTDQSDYVNAISAYMLALNYFEKIEDKEGCASIYLNLGNLFFLLEEYPKAINYQKKGKDLYKEMNNQFNESMALNSIGSSYKHLNSLDSALYYFNEAESIRIKIKDKKGLVSTLINIGSVYYEKNKYKESRSYFNKALKLKDEIGSKKEQIALFQNIALLDFEFRDYSLAIKNAKIALEFAKVTHVLSSQSDLYELLYKIYKAQNKISKALQAHEDFMLLKDSILDENKYKIINDLEEKYQTAQKDKENQKLQYENDLQKEENAKIKSQNLFIIGSSVFVAFILLISFVFLRNHQKNKFNKRMLQEIDEQNDLIAKNLHDGMSGYLHAIKNRLEFRQEKSEDLNQEIEIINRSQSELRFLMRQLSSPYYKNKNFDLSRELNELNHFYESTSSFKIDAHFDQSIIWKNISYENKLQIYKLAQELLANVKKHSGANHISLQMIKDKNNLVLSMEDNGKGFDKEESASGYGLKNMEKRIKDLKGDLNIDSKPGEGTFISFSVPVLT